MLMTTLKADFLLQTRFKATIYLSVLLLAGGVQSISLADDHAHEHKIEEHHENPFQEHHFESEHSHAGHDKSNHLHDIEHNHHEAHEEPKLTFSKAELEEFSIQLAKTKSGEISKTLDLTGEVIIAPERMFRVAPGISGVVRKVFKNLGDQVKSGDLLVTLSSRDLADAKAQYVATNSLLKLANASLKRESELFNKKVTAKRKYLEAKQVQTEISIKQNAAQQRLLAIGLTKQSIASVLNNKDKDLSLYELRAPASGVIINKNLALGDLLESHTTSFTVADLSQVWINLTVYQKDLPFIHQGQQVSISTRFSTSENVTPSVISWISPVLDETTRSATARIILDNTKGQWRPGLFVSAKVNTSTSHAGIVIPLSALQTIDGNSIVFVQHEEGEFKPQVVQLGRRDHSQVEVLRGLSANQIYVSKNAFVLKAQSQKGSFGHGHSH